MVVVLRAAGEVEVDELGEGRLGGVDPLAVRELLVVLRDGLGPALVVEVDDLVLGTRSLG